MAVSPDQGLSNCMGQAPCDAFVCAILLQQTVQPSRGFGRLRAAETSAARPISSPISTLSSQAEPPVNPISRTVTLRRGPPGAPDCPVGPATSHYRYTSTNCGALRLRALDPTPASSLPFTPLFSFSAPPSLYLYSSIRPQQPLLSIPSTSSSVLPPFSLSPTAPLSPQRDDRLVCP